MFFIDGKYVGHVWWVATFDMIVVHSYSDWHPMFVRARHYFPNDRGIVVCPD